MGRRLFIFPVFPALVAMYLPFCASEVRLTTTPLDGPPARLWEEPKNLADRDLFNGPWGAALAPDPRTSTTPAAARAATPPVSRRPRRSPGCRRD